MTLTIPAQRGKTFGSTLPRGLAEPAHRFRRNWTAVVALGLILFLLVACLIAPLFLPDPNAVDMTQRLAGPSSLHLLGTDHLGRDLLARTLVGGRVSFFTAVAATVATLVPAVILGIFAGYFRGILDDTLSRVFDVLLAIPTLLLAIVIVAAAGPSLGSIVIAIAIADIPRYARLSRILTMKALETEYVTNGIALGYSHLRIMLRHIWPSIYVTIFIIAAGRFGGVAMAEASLSFLGVGIQPPDPSLGNIVAQGQSYLALHPLFVMVPGVVLTTLTVSFCFFGDGLRDAFDVRDEGIR